MNPSKHHQGLSIEFKSPTGKGVVSESQDKFISKMKSNTNFKVIVSNNYDDIIIELVEYFRNVMIKCTYCSGKFKNEQTLKNHCKHFHRIN